MRRCEVLINGVYAGMLTEHEDPREYSFSYDADYHGAPICLAMPVQAEEYRSEHLFPYFANLLSEGDNRTLQAATLHLDKDDDFGFLLETAKVDTVGAVTVRPFQ